MPQIYFKINEECGYTLTAGTTYKYRFYAVVNGTTYWSEESAFQTSPHTTELKNIRFATCTEDGYSGDLICSTCGVTVKEGTITAATGHTWNSGKVTTAATTDAEGVMTYTCTACGATKTEAIAKLVNPFSDVDTNEWYGPSVLWAVNKNITNGTSDTTFSPTQDCTRGQIVTFLWRSANCPEPTSTTNPFTDVSADAYYYKAVLWAVENDITNGMTETTFEPGTTCTRAQAVTFLYRSEGQQSVEANNPFTDVPGGQWYTNAVLWAVANNITNGMTETTFEPNRTCTRGHIVTFLYRAAA